MKTLPTSRQERLIIEELTDEVLIYDLDRDRAHCLNQAAAFVWRQCDGRTTVAEALVRFEEEFGANADETMIWLGLDQLEKSDLLQERVKRPDRMNRVSRRALIRSMGLAAAVAVPLITSIGIPTVQAFTSCAPNGASCFGNGNCCSNNCVATAGGGAGTCAP
jgi:Coenzyme PQQ synthesis protein D (PqqD)